MNKTEDERLCRDQSCTSGARCEGQTPSWAVASWLLGTVNGLKYLGSCWGRGQELFSLAAQGFFLSLSSCLQSEMRTYLTELHTAEVEMGQKCVAV